MRVSVPRFWIGWLTGLGTCAVLGVIVGAAFVFGGAYDVSASSGHAKPVAWAIHGTMISSVRRRAQANPVSLRSDPATLGEGAAVYEEHCMACHGGPGVDRAPWAAAMVPTPPFLLGSAKEWSPAELREIIAGGVKMTGMPAWGQILPKRQIDAVTALTVALPHLGTQDFARLRAAGRLRPETALDASGPAAADPAPASSHI